ncbi:MAG: right-handed parallel beta-helix repeat-containing protein [Clostridia bacterium]|nr:right-handed parallel beta-helix repeat-containing protein [Clostridia bacterium]
MPRIYYVAPHGCDCAPGTLEAPFRTIDHAATVALPGDTVRVREGEYREWVDPREGGLSNALRITYEAMPGEHVVIKGSEVVKGWTLTDGTVWQVTLDNTMFGDWNPFKQAVEGDWLMSPRENPVHTGDVYLNGKSMYEAYSVDEVRAAVRRESGHQVPGKIAREPILDPGFTIYQWYAEVGEDATTVYANFHGADPNKELVEINVRPCCFYPRKPGRNYITVRGFEMCQAACPFTPPTADQIGMLGAHWSKGWVIEDNHLHDAKCSAISLGKEASTGHNLYSRFDRKPGYQYQMEAVFLGLQAGWCREKIGSHIVRNNVIHDCGQNGVVGHMGAAFSTIVHNHIYNIGVKREFFGYEIGGIKLHAAVDAVIENNYIHHCEMGLWLDWQAQGTRVTRNVFHHNDRDCMIEVTHGPCLVDNNIFASPHVFDNAAQGTAYVHNLICGYMDHWPVLDRATPYHFPHTTAVAGCAVVYSGDDRLYNNIYAGTYAPATDRQTAGTHGYDRFTTPEEYPQRLEAEGNTDEAKFYKVPQPVWADGNAYAGHAKPFRGEQAPFVTDTIPVTIVEEADCCMLEITLPQEAAAWQCAPVTTERLGMPRITEEAFENPDGTPVDFTRDLLDCCREAAVPGPLAKIAAGKQRVVVWEK